MKDGGAGPTGGRAGPDGSGAGPDGSGAGRDETGAGPAALETYLGGVDPAAAPVVVALDQVIRGAYPGFDVAVRYRIFMYTLSGDWRTWVCAIDASIKSVGLRFLYGVLLDDPQHVLRAGSSVLKTWDFAFDEVVDVTAVGAYVREAVARHAEYKANSRAILEASRAEASRPKGTRDA